MVRNAERDPAGGRGAERRPVDTLQYLPRLLTALPPVGSLPRGLALLTLTGTTLSLPVTTRSYAQDARPVVHAPVSPSRRGVLAPRSRTGVMNEAPPAEVGFGREVGPALEATGLVVVAPRSGPFLRALEQAQAIFASVEPGVTAEGPLETLVDAWIDRHPGRERTPPVLRGIREARDLRARGIDPEAPFLIAVDPVDRLLAFSLGLSDRPRFEQWLDSNAHGRFERITVAAESARVIGARSDDPVTCLARHRRAMCQVGVRPGPRPLAPLERMARGQSLTVPRGVARAFRALDRGAVAYMLVRPHILADAARAMLAAEAQRAHRFDPAATRHRATARARHRARKLDRLARKAEGGALALYIGARAVEVGAEIILTAEGRRHLIRSLGAEPVPSVVRRWARTPALVSLAARLHPALLSRLAAHYNLPLPAAALTGDVALLTLGIDASCPLAKHARRQDELDWAFVLPTAVALGLKPAGSRALYAGLARVLDAEAAPRPAYGARARLSRATLRGRAAGRRYEVDLTDEVLFASAGPGSGAAALRRLLTLPPSSRRTPPLVEASVDLAAVDAAFAGGSFSPEHRRELLKLEALRLTLKPLLAHVRNVDLTVQARNAGRRLSIKIGLNPP